MQFGTRVSFRFDRFTLDADTRRLLRDADEVHLSPKALQLLQLLIENRSRAMSHRAPRSCASGLTTDASSRESSSALTIEMRLSVRFAKSRPA